MHYQPQLHSDALQHQQAVAAVLGMTQQHAQQSPHSSSPYHLTTGQQSPDIKPNLSHLNSLGNSANGSSVGNGLLPTNLCVPNSTGSPLTSTTVAYHHPQAGMPANSLMYNHNDQFNAAAAAVRAAYSNDFDTKIALNQNLNNLSLGSTYGQQLNSHLNSQLNSQLNQFNGAQLPSNNNLNPGTPSYLSGAGYPSSNITNCSPVGSMMSNGPISPNGTTRDSMGNFEPKDGNLSILGFAFFFFNFLS